jgi:hypothetical protein
MSNLPVRSMSTSQEVEVEVSVMKAEEDGVVMMVMEVEEGWMTTSGVVLEKN